MRVVSSVWPRKARIKMRTFDDWKNVDRVVKKGEKATWVDGVALFSIEQTKEIQTFDSVGDYNEEYMDAFADAFMADVECR